MNPLAINIILDKEFSRVRTLLEKNYDLEWKVALSQILEPDRK
jgi:hypothetical protein